MSASEFTNVSAYRFVPINDPESLRDSLREALAAIGVRGAVLIAGEGININLTGTSEQVQAVRALFARDARFSDLWFKTTQCDFVPHRRLKVRVRTEIIGFDDRPVPPAERPSAPFVAPETLDQWLTEQRPMTLLDTRNDYEVASGTFRDALHLDIKHFRHFKAAVREALEQGRLDKKQPMVTFCTGGIRCEKAAPWLLEEGFETVYQIEGGLIHYLQQSQADHWQGHCFVFDDRVELDTALQPTGAGLCEWCQLAVPAGQTCECQLGYHHHATY